MEFQSVVLKRRMVRNFEKRSLPPETVERILANSLRAPSAGYTQGQEFLVFEGADQTSRFWEVADGEAFRQSIWSGILNAPLIVVCLSHKQAYVDRYAEPDKGWTDRDESRWPTPYWHIDAGFSALLMLLTAIDAGLGSAFFSIFNVEGFRSRYGIPPEYHPIGAVAVGYPLPDERSPSLKRGRRPPEEVIHRGAW